MEWLKRNENEWYTKSSENKLFIRRVEDYHEIVGGDFYQFLDMTHYAVLDWQSPQKPVLAAFDNLEEAQERLLELLEG